MDMYYHARAQAASRVCCILLVGDHPDRPANGNGTARRLQRRPIEPAADCDTLDRRGRTRNTHKKQDDTNITP